jgi:hypothetical protein
LIRIIFLILLFTLTACNPLSEGQEGSVKGANYHPGITGERTFTKTWSFTEAPAEYIFPSNYVELTSGQARLIASDQLDDDNSLDGFGGGTSVGLEWDQTIGAVRLKSDGPSVNLTNLGPSWTPKYSQIVSYFTLDGSGAISDTQLIPAAVGNNGVASNGGAGMNYTAGKVNEAITFDGVNDYIDAPHASNLHFTSGDSISISVWAKPTSLAQYGTILTKGRSSGIDDANFAIRNISGNSALLNFYFRAANNSWSVWTSTRKVFTLNQWHHIVVTFTFGDASSFRAYVNGIESPGNWAGSGSAVPIVSTNPLRIGANDYPGASLADERFTGSIDDIAIWRAKLTASEALTIFSHQQTKYRSEYDSRVFDGFDTNQPWDSIRWLTSLPFNKELPDALCSPVPPATTCAHTNQESSEHYSSLVGSTGNMNDDDLMNEIIGIWHLNEATGTSGANSIIDSSGQNNHGTPYGAMAFGQDGILSKAASFNGTNSYIRIPPDISLGSINYRGSISFWAKGSGIAIGIDRTSSSQAGVVNIMVADTSFTYKLCDLTSSPFCTSLIVNKAIDTSRWNHFAFTGDGSGNYQLSVNGEVTPFTHTFNDLGVAFTKVMIGYNHNHTWGDLYFNGQMDEIAIWSRPLMALEIQQLYRRGANRIKLQVRNCIAADCSDDSSGANWKGSDGSNQTYFSELNNTTKNSPSILFSSFLNPVGNSRFFQYRLILESDDEGSNCDYGAGATWCSPELKSVQLDPVHYATEGASIVGKKGVSFNQLENFLDTLGSEGCSAGVVYNLGIGSSSATASWFWWNGSKWVNTNGTAVEGNTSSVIASNLSSFGKQVGKGIVYFKAFLKSDGLSACALDEVQLSGRQSSSDN